MISTAIKNPYLVIVACLLVTVLGASLFTKIPADLLPVFDTPAVQIVTFYPGMPPEVMERDIMSRLQRWTAQSVGIEHQEAKAMLGVCIVKDFFREDISFDTAMSQVTSYAVSDMYYLPPGTVPPMVMPFDPTASVPLALVTVSTTDNSLNEKELYDIAYYQLRNNLQSIGGVIAPAVYGGTLRRILSYVDPDKMRAHGLTPMDVVRALKKNNVLVPAGNAKMGTRDWQIFTNAIPKEVEDLNRMPVKVINGKMILMRDIGRVEDASQIQSNIVRINGSRQVYIPIYRQPGANTIEIVDSIKFELSTILGNLRESDPKAKNLVLEVAMDQSGYVRKSIEGLQLAAMLGAIFAALVVLVFLRSFSSTFIVFLAIPISLIAAILGLYATNQSLNAMTLGGLALAVGILVDQSIVVLENISRHLKMGKTSMEAAIDGAREVFFPVLISTLTFVLVFFPVLFLTGIAKFLFTPLALAAGFAIVASFFVAMTLIPSLAARMLKAKGGSLVVESGRGGVFGAIIKLRYLVLLIAAIMVFGGWKLLENRGTELFPKVDARQFTMLVRMPSGTRIEITEETVADIEALLIAELGQPDPEFPANEAHPDSSLKLLISNIGVLMDWPAAYTPNVGPMDAFVLVQLKDKAGDSVFDVVESLRGKLRKKFPEVEFSFDTGGMLTAALNFGEPSPIHFQATGGDLGTLEDIATRVRNAMEGVEGVRDVRIAQRMDYPLVNVTVDRIQAARVGVDMDDVVKNLASATNSSVGFDPAFWIDEKNGNHYFIGVQYEESKIDSLESLMDIPVGGMGGHDPVPLRQVAEFSTGTGPAVVSHRNIKRVIDVYANVSKEADVGTVLAECERRIEALEGLGLVKEQSSRGEVYKINGDFSGKGYRLSLQGEMKTLRSAASEFGFGLMIAMVMIYLAMVAQFRSFLDPLVILLSVPLGFVGVAVALSLSGIALSIPVFMGVIMMTGTVVEYTIILVEFANRRLAENPALTAAEAVIGAARARMKPIVMAALTTVLALLPMALGFGGGDANVPLATTIIGGVIGAVILSMIVTPCLYAILKPTKPVIRRQTKFSRFFRSDLKKRENLV